MIVTSRTTADEFLRQTQWQLDAPSDRDRFETAFKYMLRHVPLGVLNLPDHSSPWTPGGGHRTKLVSWLQGIRFSAPVNADESVSKGTVLKQFRLVSDPPGARGNWFTAAPSQLQFMALPQGEYRADYYIAATNFRCLLSRISDAFAGWSNAPDPYRHGGAKQFFIYAGGQLASCLVPAKPAST